MKKILPVIIGIILCYGCSKSNSAKPVSITGRWSYIGDVSTTTKNDTLTNTYVYNTASCYYQFNADGSGTAVRDYNGLVTQDFTYTMTGKTITFHFATSRNDNNGFVTEAYSAQAAITQLTSNNLAIIYENTRIDGGATITDKETITMKK